MKTYYRLAPGFESLEPFVKDLPAIFPVRGETIFLDRNEVKVFHEGGYALNVKSFKLPNFINRFVYVYFRGSKAARSFANACRFLDAGAATPIPVGYLERTHGGRLQDSYYISLQYDHDFTLRDVLNGLIPDKERILLEFVRFTWQHLHKAGIYHLDYSPGNTLIRKTDDHYSFAVVDLNRMKFFPVGFEMGIRNFRQLDTDTETIRLIATTYAALCGESPEKAIAILLEYDRKNKAFRKRKGDFKAFLGRDTDD
ncbi:MAG: hypothetical protein LWW85_10875 [Marinilabiliales bacterium]|nr:hypothetical protein [Marinilabiliales bacterium]